METETWLALGGIAVSVTAIPIAVWATWRWGTRRGRILFTWESTSLMPIKATGANSPANDLQVTFRDVAVPDPYLVSLTIRNIGPIDISRNHFDAGLPIRVTLNCVMYSVVAASGGIVTWGDMGGDGLVKFEASLLKRGETWTADAVVSGEPKPELRNTLIDVDLADRPPYDRDLMRLLREIPFPGTPFGLLAWSLTRLITPIRSGGRS